MTEHHMDIKEYTSRVTTFNAIYPDGGTRGVRMPDVDRKEAIALLNYGCSTGLSSKASARKLRLTDGAIRRWEHGFKGGKAKTRAKRSTPARSYAVAAKPKAVPASLSLTLPNGVKVSGLTLDQLKELIRV